MPQRRDNETLEWRLLCLLARIPLSEVQLSQAADLIAQGADAKELAQLAQYHGVAPLLAHHAHRHFPALLTARLEQYARHNAIRSHLLAQALQEMLEDCLNAHLSVVPIKGPTLAVQAYGALDLRDFCDIDLLVQRADFDAVERLALQKGYAHKYPYPETRRKDVMRHRYDLPLLRGRDGIVLELHWRLHFGYAGLAFEQLSWPKHLRQIECNGVEIPILAAEEMLLLLCIHGSKDGWDRLKLLVDVAQVLRVSVAFDWTRFWQLARAANAERLCRIALRWVNELLQAPLPVTLRSELRADQSLVEPLEYAWHLLFTECDYDETMLARHRYFIKAQAHWWQRLRYIAGFALTPGSTEWNYVELPARLSFVYRWLRVARLVKLYGRRWLRKMID